MAPGVLSRVRVRNFQSHADTTVNLGPGINAFIGESDQGKSAVLRGLLWAVDNRPSGDAIVSDWARDEKGTITDECSVTVDSDAGTLRRIKTKSRNGYDVNGVKLDAIRTGVPEEVSAFFGIESVNVQRQLDPPFLLSDSGGSRARFFNQLIKLEEIDQTMTAAESLRRATAAAIKPLEADIQAVHLSLSGLSRIGAVSDLANALEDEESHLLILETRKASLVVLLESLRKARGEVARYQGLEAIEAKADLLDDLAGELSQASRRYNGIHGVVTSLRATRESLSRLPYVEAVEGRLDDLEVDQLLQLGEDARKTRLIALLDALRAARTTAALPNPEPIEASLTSMEKLATAAHRFGERKRNLRALLDDIREKRAVLPYIDREIEALLASLPETCPTCGAPMKGE